MTVGTKVTPNEQYWQVKLKKNKFGVEIDKTIKCPNGLTGTIKDIDYQKRMAIVTWDHNLRQVMKLAKGPGENVDTIMPVYNEKTTFKYSIGLKKTYHLDFA